MRRRRLTRDESRAQTRARLLGAARKAFARDGFQGASMEEIAEDAGYTIGALYSNFESKSDLFVAAFEDYVGQRAREIEVAVASQEGPQGPAEKAAQQWMDKLATDPRWFPVFLEFCASAARDPQLSGKLAVPLGAVRVAIGRLIAAHVEETGVELTLPSEEIATVIKALGNGLALERIIDPDGVPDALFGLSLDALFRGLESAVVRRPSTVRPN